MDALIADSRELGDTLLAFTADTLLALAHAHFPGWRIPRSFAGHAVDADVRVSEREHGVDGEREERVAELAAVGDQRVHCAYSSSMRSAAHSPSWTSTRYRSRSGWSGSTMRGSSHRNAAFTKLAQPSP